MKLAISNIAWIPDEDDAVAEVMREEAVDAVEIAPTLYWKDPLAAAPGEVEAVRNAWKRRGFSVIALQSLLFGQPRPQLLERDTSAELESRLEGMIRLAAQLGARVLVLGSPQNRRRGNLSGAAAIKAAVPVLRRLGDRASELGATLCIEPNPPVYGCDFVTTAAEGRELVSRVSSPGFGLHLDLAAMHLAGDDPALELARSLPLLRHVHLSAPELAPVRPGAIDYAAALAALHRGGYEGFVSVEMRATGDPRARVAQVAQALRFIRSLASITQSLS